jgi:glycosyltransferase involved in cell wall biosynthesis
MKIALVCGHFVSSMGYVEVYYAKELARQGHEVEVFTSAVIPSYVRSFVKEELEIGATIIEGYSIQRLPHKFSVGQMIKAKGLTNAVDSFMPELIIAIGLGKLFPEPVFKLGGKYPIITLLGDNSESQESMNAKPLVDTVKQALKKRVYKKAVKQSKQLFSYTPESLEVVQGIVGKRLAAIAKEKNHEISLGFDEQKFFFDSEERDEVRRKLKIGDTDKVMVTATRIIPQKQLEEVVDEVDRINLSGGSLKYILIGFLDDEYGRQLKSYINDKRSRDQFICLPFMDFEMVRKHYSAADFAHFPSAVISIFEAMGTGLPVILPNHRNVSHILDDKNGVYYNNTLAEVLGSYLQNLEEGVHVEREELLKYNSERYSYQQLVKQVLSLMV